MGKIGFLKQDMTSTHNKRKRWEKSEISLKDAINFCKVFAVGKVFAVCTVHPTNNSDSEFIKNFYKLIETRQITQLKNG